jgi:hypothetical protein
MIRRHTVTIVLDNNIPKITTLIGEFDIDFRAIGINTVTDRLPE